MSSTLRKKKAHCQCKQTDIPSKLLALLEVCMSGSGLTDTVRFVIPKNDQEPAAEFVWQLRPNKPEHKVLYNAVHCSCCVYLSFNIFPPDPKQENPLKCSATPRLRPLQRCCKLAVIGKVAPRMDWCCNVARLWQAACIYFVRVWTWTRWPWLHY